MLFNSFEFLLFFPLVIMLYFSMPYRYRWVLLLVASYYFYMSWKPEYAILLLISTLVDYYAASQMATKPDKKARRPYLILSMVSNLGLLFSFKYFNFFRDNWNPLMDQLGLFAHLPELQILLPVGISFYTFQTMSYTIDVYKGDMKPEKHLGIFAVYVTFFPQLVAGPIERAPHLLPQFRQNFDFDYARVREGLILMLWGFFKKLIIADRVAEYVNGIYDAPQVKEGLTNLVASYLFAFQIYCDFSGYSDIAVGASLIMGYRLMKNFERPYFADSIQNFWKRWHISLSTWFRDYLYIPLGGNRTVKWRWWYNLFITFLISGLWHGAAWTFIIWGGLHGALLVIGLWTTSLRERFMRITGLARLPKLRRLVEMFVVFHLVIIGWVFFRAENLQDALVVLKSFVQIRPSAVGPLLDSLQSFGWLEFVIALGAIFTMEFLHYLQERGWSLHQKVGALSMPVRWGLYLVATMAIVLFGKFSSQAEFIYFQF